MRHYHIPILLCAWMGLSAFNYCFIICSENTTIQQDYTRKRDHCRELAELKADIRGNTSDDMEARKTQLVSIFSECMGQQGWAVPKPGADADKKGTITAGPLGSGLGRSASAANNEKTQEAPLPSQPATEPTLTEEEQAYRRRAAECAFARHAADISVVSRTRAEACDLECTDRLKHGALGVKPAACVP